MNVRRRSIHAPLAVAVAALMLALSACSSEHPTDAVYNPAVGVNDQSGQVDVLNAVIASGSDGGGTLVATLVNNSAEEDALTGIVGDGEEQGVEVALSGETTLDGDQLVNLADEGGVQVSGDRVVVGAFVTLTFSFANAEAVTLDVPVVEQGSDGPYADLPTS